MKKDILKQIVNNVENIILCHDEAWELIEDAHLLLKDKEISPVYLIKNAFERCNIVASELEKLRVSINILIQSKMSKPKNKNKSKKS